MDSLLLIIGGILMITGIAGSLLPVLPGLPFSYLGLLLIQFSSKAPFSPPFLIGWLLVVLLLMFADNILPALGAKKMGGTHFGVWGSIIGIIVGPFVFGIPGIIIGPFLGAFAAELFSGKKTGEAMKAALGTILGFALSVFVKFIVAMVMAIYFFTSI